jgi:N6-L-threonylcarbamoyladenine synthase
MRLIGIETSCDETGIGLVEDGQIRANVVASSQQFHTRYGGVVPEIAARVHVEVIWHVLEDALTQADWSVNDLEAIAVTQGPGLPGALLIGVAFAKGLALALDRPLLGVEHLAAHLYAGQMIDPTVEPPYIGLVVSGGHTLLCVVQPNQQFELLGETKDDAVGEAFDKVAKLLGLGYPGGPIIDRLSEEGQRAAVTFPRGGAREGFDFSFSGLKTAVYQHVQKCIHEMALGSRLKAEGKSLEPRASSLERVSVVNIAASFQEAAVDMLVTKAWRACEQSGLRTVVVGGGVAANRRLRERLAQEGQARGLHVVIPPPALCVDNGVMIAGLASELLRQGRRSSMAMNADQSLPLGGAYN